MEQNYFDHFDLPVQFQLDLESVRKKYLVISRQNHPDFAAGEDEAYEQALMATSFNNQAYNVLSNNYERIKYVLELLGSPISTDDKLPPTFLMEMMDWNERIMEAGMTDDSTTLSTLSVEFDALEKSFDAELNEKLAAFDSSKNQELLEEIKKSYLERKYLLRLRDSIDKFARL